jgi:hypothetical protein
MDQEDLRTLASVGRALWADTRESQLATIETLSAVTLLDLTPDRAVERAAVALLERVSRRGATAQWAQPFFRLEAEERLTLVALHQGRWSYARLGRVFGLTTEQVEALAWSARLQLASAIGTAYPAGAPQRGPNCPEYDSQRPWTQRFLDDEVSSGRERLFLQNHLMACGSCRDALNRCRETYYALEASLPQLSEAAGDTRLLQNLKSVTRKGLGLKAPAERSFVESLEVFFRRRDVRWAMAIFTGVVAFKLTQLLRG